MYLVSSRFGFTVTVCVPASRPVTSILPFSVVPESVSISDLVPLTMTLLLSVTNVSVYPSSSPSYVILELFSVMVEVAFVSIFISILSFALDELTIKTPSGRYPVRSTDVLISSVAPDISIGPTSIDVILFKASALPLSITDSSDSSTPSTLFPPAGEPVVVHLIGTSLVLRTSTVTAID